MVKKVLCSFFLCLCFSSAVFAEKVIDQFITTSKSPYKVELRKVFDGQSMSVKAGKTLFNIRLSGIICDEYESYSMRESSSGKKYSIEDINYRKPYYASSNQAFSKKAATNFLRDFLKTNENNLYFQQEGRGYYFSVVGELFVGRTSVNKMLVEKGYCRPIE